MALDHCCGSKQHLAINKKCYEGIFMSSWWKITTELMMIQLLRFTAPQTHFPGYARGAAQLTVFITVHKVKEANVALTTVLHLYTVSSWHGAFSFSAALLYLIWVTGLRCLQLFCAIIRLISFSSVNMCCFILVLCKLPWQKDGSTDFFYSIDPLLVFGLLNLAVEKVTI